MLIQFRPGEGRAHHFAMREQNDLALGDKPELLSRCGTEFRADCKRSCEPIARAEHGNGDHVEESVVHADSINRFLALQGLVQSTLRVLFKPGNREEWIAPRRGQDCAFSWRHQQHVHALYPEQIYQKGIQRLWISGLE